MSVVMCSGPSNLATFGLLNLLINSYLCILLIVYGEQYKLYQNREGD